MSFVVRCDIYFSVVQTKFPNGSWVPPIRENTITSYLIIATCKTMLLFIETKAENLSLIEVQSGKT